MSHKCLYDGNRCAELKAGSSCLEDRCDRYVVDTSVKEEKVKDKKKSSDK
jgi:hypothetical protein